MPRLVDVAGHRYFVRRITDHEAIADGVAGNPDSLRFLPEGGFEVIGPAGAGHVAAWEWHEEWATPVAPTPCHPARAAVEPSFARLRRDRPPAPLPRW